MPSRLHLDQSSSSLPRAPATVSLVTEPQKWADLAGRFADYNYRHLWDYGPATAARQKARCEHIMISDGGEVIGLAAVRIKSLPVVGGIAYIGGGPLTRQNINNDPGNLSACLGALQDHYVGRKKLLLRIQAPAGDAQWNSDAEKIFLGASFIAAAHPLPYRTLLVDLSPPLEKIRAALAQKWRNGLNQAQRNNLRVRSDREQTSLDHFCRMFNGFISRKGFHVELDAEFFSGVQKNLTGADRFVTTLVENDQGVVAGHLASFLGETCVYLLGVTEEAALASKAAYLLQWHVLSLAKEQGFRWYDLGGIDANENPGVYHFKKGIGGIEVLAPGPFECAPPGIVPGLVRWAENTYRWARKRRQSKKQPAEPKSPPSK